jgi:hypothetical protein
MRFLRPAVILATAAACGGKGSAPASVASPAPVASAPADGPAARVVNATILANGCQALGRPNARLAESAMYQLVEACSSVPGGVAQFEATLQPGGRIEIAAAPGQPDVVPICILKHSLTHRVALTRPCRLDVRMEQTSVPVPQQRGQR